MSDLTVDNLDAAMQAHVDSVRGGYLVTGYTLTCHLSTIEDNRSHYYFMQPARQPYHVTLGLMQLSIDDYINGEEEDDDDD